MASITRKLAWRSFLRHRRRSIITVSAVAMSLAMMLVFVGIGDDGHARMAELGIRMGSGHVLVHGSGYQAEETLERIVVDPAQVERVARALPAVRLAVPRLRTNGLLTAGEKSAPVLVSGVRPALEKKASLIPEDKRRVTGQYVRAPSQMPFPNMPPDIYIGSEMARKLEVSVGDRVVLAVSPRGSARPTQAAFVVSGTFRVGVQEVDEGWVEVPLEPLQQLLGVGEGATQVALLLNELGQTTDVALAMQAQLPEQLEVLRWQEALRELHEAILLDDAGLYLMMAIIFVIVGIGIFNTVLMSVVERTREFGVMMALGCAGRRLFRVVMTEALILSVVSAALGVALGLLLHWYVADTGIDVTRWAKDYQIAGIVMEGRIYSRLSTWVVLKWTLVVMAITLVSATYPAVKAARLTPLQAMRHV